MSEARVSVVPADADDDAIGFVEQLLAANDLPTADVRSGPADFYVGHDDGNRVAVGGLECYGTDGLLRSLAVDADVRGRGVGAAMCEALEAEARADGVGTLYLLTTTAADFFAAQGYEAVDRGEAPADIRETTQFADLCPSSAVCMRKRL